MNMEVAKPRMSKKMEAKENGKENNGNLANSNHGINVLGSYIFFIFFLNKKIKF